MIALLLVALAAPVRAERADAEFSAVLEAARADMSGRAAAAKSAAAPPQTPSQARAQIKVLLKDKGVPDAYADAVFDDPRLKIYPEIPGKFEGGTTKPEAVPYEQYRKYFMTEERIAAGARFMRDHAALLKEVEARGKVDGGLLTGLVAVETYYGTRVGTYSVFDALYTIVLKVPSRSSWAARECAAVIAMAYAQKLDAHAIPGSYAGAFGYVQFEPTSYQHFAVDFDGDGQKRLDQWPDALGSAANYLRLSGYRQGDPFTPESSIGRSLYSYNHSENYVRVILELRAAIMKRLP